MTWFLWTIFLLQFCRIFSISPCKVPGFICTVTSRECPSEIGNHDVIWNIDKFEIEPYQKTMVTDFENKYYPGLSIEIVKDISRSEVSTSGVQLSIIPSNGTERCLTMIARNDSMDNANISTKEITFSLDFYPFGNDYSHSVFRAYSYEGNTRSMTYAEQRVSLQSAVPAPTPENSSQWTTTIVYQIDSKNKTVSSTFAYPPSSLNMTHFIVSLQKLVTVKVPFLGGEERRKTKEEQIIDTNKYTFTNVSNGFYRILVMPWDITRKVKIPAIPRQRKTSLCKLGGMPSKCRASSTDIFEISDGGMPSKFRVSSTDIFEISDGGMPSTFRVSSTDSFEISDGGMSSTFRESSTDSYEISDAATTTTTQPLPQRSDISCNADSIDTFVPISMLPSGAPLTWRDPTCSVTSNGTHMISSIGLSQCGTTVTITKDNVEFENELKAQSTNSTANSLIDFGEDAYVIPVKCVYPRTETPMTSYVPLQQHVRFYEKRYGHFDVDIMQYDSDKFSSAIQNLGTPRKVALNSEIYVEVKLSDQFNNGLGIHIDKCIATPTSSPSDSTLYTLLTDGCPASQHVHLYNSPANKVRFGVRAFQFTSQTGAMVYIHCQTSMCQAGTPYCTSNCVTAGRRKRDVAPDQKSHLVSAGPFVLVADEQGTPIRMSTIVASVSAFVAVVACVVAIVGWTRKTRTTSTKEQGLL